MKGAICYLGWGYAKSSFVGGDRPWCPPLGETITLSESLLWVKKVSVKHSNLSSELKVCDGNSHFQKKMFLKEMKMKIATKILEMNHEKIDKTIYFASETRFN